MKDYLISETIYIAAPPDLVWHTLTDKNEMLRWMGAEELQLHLNFIWEVGQPITISGFHHEHFRNSGIVLKVNKPQILTYTQKSSISNLPEDPQSYSIFRFLLTPAAGGTELNLTIRQFPTETIFLHLQFYWKPTLRIIKQMIEE